MFTSERRLLAVENLAVDYDGYVALAGVSLEVRTGQTVALMSTPRFMMLDEPFLGLSPRLVAEVAETILRLNADGMTVLFTEQAIHQSLITSHRGYILESGRLVLSGTSAELLGNEMLQRVYMGLDLEAS